MTTKKTTVDEVLLLLAVRDFIESDADADQFAKIVGDLFGVKCTPNPDVEYGYDIEVDEAYTGKLAVVFNDIE
jgi:hypothetical protein